jgi:hypothetical protein
MPRQFLALSVTWPEDTPRSAALLAAVALALLALMVLLVLVARVGTAIAAEVHRAQSDYLRLAVDRPGAIDNALKLGQCLRRQLQTQAAEGIAAPREWVESRRAVIETQCQATLEPLGDVVPERHRRRLAVILDSSSSTKSTAADPTSGIPFRSR